MDYSTIIQNLNKIAVGAFVAVLGLIIFETWMMLKSKKKKNTVVDIPDFNLNSTTATKAVASVVQPAPVVQTPPIVPVGKSKPHLAFIVFLIVVLSGLLMVSGYYFYSNSSNTTNESEITTSNTTQAQQTKLVESSGIMLFNNKWERIHAENVQASPGDLIFIGVETVAGSDIDKARIRVNKQAWGVEDETTNTNSQYGVFYREYTISSEESKLEIDAELHSFSNGWLQN